MIEKMHSNIETPKFMYYVSLQSLDTKANKKDEIAKVRPSIVNIKVPANI